jgi:hypothetical protein
MSSLRDSALQVPTSLQQQKPEKRRSSSPRQDAVRSDWRERRKKTTDSSPKPISEKNEQLAAASQGLSLETKQPAGALIRRPWRKDFTKQILSIFVF